MTEKEIPEDWGKDALSAFFELDNRNTFGAFVHYKEWFTRLREIDAAFIGFSENMLNISVFYEPFLTFFLPSRFSSCN